MPTWAVDPESWRPASAQIRGFSTQLHEGSLSPSDVRNGTIEILHALSADSPDTTGYLESLIRIIQDSTEEKLATKVGLVADEVAKEANVAADLDEGHRGRLGP
jgi:hypothetical protein